MQFGRDLKRRAGKPWLEAGAVELLPLAMLRREAAAAGLNAHQAEKHERADQLLLYSRLSGEIARRTGEAEPLGKATAAAERAARLASRPIDAAAARLAQASLALLSGLLYGETTATDAAQAWLATPEVAAAPALADEALALRARSEAARALSGPDLDRAVEAAGVLDAAVERLDAAAREDAAFKTAAAALRCDRAEFLIAFGQRLKDRTLIVQAEADLRELSQRLDRDYSPLSWVRSEGLRGLAQASLGDLTGEPSQIAEAVLTMTRAAEEVDFDHSPLDRARLSHGLGLALHALGEACDDDGPFDHSLAAFDQALVALDPVPLLPLRAMAAFDRACAVARRAERAGDLRALRQAAGAFKAELSRPGAASDPVAWAVAQLGMARIYEIEAEIEGADGPPSETAFALTEAVEVFTEQGMTTLARTAEAALGRLRSARERS